MRKRSKNGKSFKTYCLSVILILLIFLVITAGTVMLLKMLQPSPAPDTGLSDDATEFQDETNPQIHDDTADSVDSEVISSSESISETIEDSLQEAPSESLPEEDSIPMLTVTIPDRSTFPEIVSILSTVSGLSEDKIYQQADALLQQIPDSDAAASCYFPLEGYILSGIYELPEEEPLLEHLLKGSLDRITGIASSDVYTIHEILSMASIIEIESSRGGLSEHDPQQMPHIASVIFNRLNSGMQLQMDVTFQYGYNTLQPHGADDAVLEQYNTYDAPALPIGPICSPSEEAVKAVLTPETSDDLFFVFDEDGNYYYAADYNVHLDNCVKAGIR